MGFETGFVSGQTLDAAYTSEPFVLGQKTLFSCQLVVSNTDAVGTLKLQSSNDGSNWVDIAFQDQTGATQTSISVSSGTDVNQMLSVYPATEGNYRVDYAYTSGGSSNTLSLAALGKK